MSRRNRFLGALGLLAIGVMLCVGFLYRQEIVDNYRVWQYQPSGEISQLATRAKLSDRGRFYLYAARPQLETADQFNEDCRRAEKASPILGCYQPATQTIHIYNVSDPELDGIREVTAAHEMLHMVFARLSNRQKTELEPLLDQAFAAVRTPELDERMAYYDRAQPGSRYDELHSILGTEQASLPDTLEQHYKTYFTDRQAVVALHAQYTAAFTEAQRQIDELSNALTQLKSQIDSATELYRQTLAAINAEVAAFNRRAQDGDFPSQQQFNTERHALIARSAALDRTRQSIEAMINEYNHVVEKLNGLGQKINRLNQSLDSQRVVE